MGIFTFNCDGCGKECGSCTYEPWKTENFRCKNCPSVYCYLCEQNFFAHGYVHNAISYYDYCPLCILQIKKKFIIAFVYTDTLILPIQWKPVGSKDDKHEFRGSIMSQEEKIESRQKAIATIKKCREEIEEKRKLYFTNPSPFILDDEEAIDPTISKKWCDEGEEKKQNKTKNKNKIMHKKQKKKTKNKKNSKMNCSQLLDLSFLRKKNEKIKKVLLLSFCCVLFAFMYYLIL